MNTQENFSNYSKALILYKSIDLTNKEFDTQLNQIFKGGKLTSRFIYRSICSISESNYEKDCKDFGKSKVDSLVHKVLDVLNTK